MNKEKEIIECSSEELRDLWNGVYYKGNKYEFKGDIYEQVDKIDTSRYSDGPSWDYIVKRKSDGKFFKFNVWDAGDHNGYIFEDEYLEEVHQSQKSINHYE